MQIAVSTRLFRNHGPRQGAISAGVTATALTPTNDVLLGGGDGTLALLHVLPEAPNAHPKRIQKLPLSASTKVLGAVVSIALDPACFKVKNVRLVRAS